MGDECVCIALAFCGRGWMEMGWMHSSSICISSGMLGTAMAENPNVKSKSHL